MDDKQRGWVLPCVILASGFILFLNLWARTLENHDYLRYAESAREMIRSGDWLIPHLNGKIYIDKPPLTIWLIALPSALYGNVTPFLARLPSTVAAWMGIIVAFLWIRKLYGRNVCGLVAAGVLLSSYEYFIQGRMAKTDIILSGFILLSLFFFHLGYEARRTRKVYLFIGLSWFCTGLGILTKGPLLPLLSFLVILVFLIKEKELGLLVSRPFLLGYGVLIATALPWFLLFVHRVGWEPSIALVKQTQILRRRAPVYFYFVQIWGQFFPWSLFLPFLSVGLWRQRRTLSASRESFFIIWFVTMFIFLTLYKYRASRYLLPTLPPLAFLLGGMWKRRLGLFLAPFVIVILVWHGVDFYRVRQNLPQSSGLVLVEELKPVIGDAPLSAYHLDVYLLEKINFYLDRVVPVLRKEDHPTGKGLVLMPKKTYEDLQTRGDDAVSWAREIRYEEQNLVLIFSPEHRS